ncbi:ORF15 [callitrichine gammaherpesvirus 3]|uniref:ORF15 n=1 Tax=callitrichine gammaherpesvirus 3 TaxID=106331 RepID=Q993J5_9GAMA|nr:ORF15 [callitrichine gammaherpesvirus 3]AAK38223.1 ORF15 [callitrichine gammaherpesvirus 3]
MLKCKEPGARFHQGAVHLPGGQAIFHIIESPSLASALGLKGCDVPVPALFRASGLVVREKLPLSSVKAPILSLARLVLAPNPYELEAHLTVGLTQTNGIPILFANPAIEIRGGVSTNIKAASRIVMANVTSMDQTAPFSLEDYPNISMVENVKRVRVNEGANTKRTIRDLVEIPITVLSSLNLIPTHSILKTRQQDTLPDVADFQVKNYTNIFYNLSMNTPASMTDGPAIHLSNILIANRSHNSLRLVDDPLLTPLQHLFLKHAVLGSLGLENLLPNFAAVFNKPGTQLSTDQTTHFTTLVDVVRARVENCVFCLNSIGLAKIFPAVQEDTEHPSISLALEKYFIMFPPRTSITEAVRFSTPIVHMLSSGAEFTTMARFLAQYIPVIKETDAGNLVKLYYLLRI